MIILIFMVHVLEILETAIYLFKLISMDNILACCQLPHILISIFILFLILSNNSK